MAVINKQDVTLLFNANGKVQVDVSQWDYVNAQIVTPSGSISFNSTNDGGAITGTSDGNALSALNWVSCQGTNQTSGTAETSTSAANSIHKFTSVGQFLQLIGTGVTVSKMYLEYFKIQ